MNVPTTNEKDGKFDSSDWNCCMDGDENLFVFLFFTSFLLDGCFKIPIFYINFAYKNMLSTIICFTYMMMDWRQFT